MHSHFFFLDFCLHPMAFLITLLLSISSSLSLLWKIFIIHFSCQLFPFLLHLLTPTVHRLLKGLTFPVNSKHFTTFLGTIKMSCIIWALHFFLIMSVTHRKEVHLLFSGDIYKVALLSAACCAEWCVWVGIGFTVWEHSIAFKGEVFRVCQVHVRVRAKMNLCVYILQSVS